MKFTLNFKEKNATLESDLETIADNHLERLDKRADKHMGLRLEEKRLREKKRLEEKTKQVEIKAAKKGLFVTLQEEKTKREQMRLEEKRKKKEQEQKHFIQGMLMMVGLMFVIVILFIIMGALGL